MRRPDRRPRRWQAVALVAAVALAAGGCAGGPSDPPAATASPPAASSAKPAQQQRPYDVFVPSGYRPTTPVPLVLLLHGYSSSGAEIEELLGFEAFAEERGFLYVHPDGTRDAEGYRFWDATDGCCNSADTPVDDSAYLAGIIEEVSADYSVDPRRVFLVGLSNGGFMSYRMACDHADAVAAIVSVAGATYLDQDRCQPSEPVSVAQVHGTADEVIPYDGGILAEQRFPSAPGTVALWAGYDGCSGERVAAEGRLDLDASVPDAETTVSGFEGCPQGVAVELWTVAGAPHVIAPTASFALSVLDFLFAHPKAA